MFDWITESIFDSAWENGEQSSPLGRLPAADIGIQPNTLIACSSSLEFTPNLKCRDRPEYPPGIMGIRCSCAASYWSVTAPLLAVDTSFMYFASNPRV